MNCLQLSSILAGAVLGTAAFAAQPPTFRITHIEPPPVAGSSFNVTDVNENDELTGSYLSNDFRQRAFLWQDGTVTDIGDLMGGGGFYAEALGLNDLTEVVGVSASQAGFRGFLWREGEMVDIGSLPGFDTVFANDINNRGRIIGNMDDGTSETEFLRRRNGQFVALPPLVAEGPAVANAINNRRTVVGESDSSQGRRAVSWLGGVVTNLGTLPGDVSSVAADINDHGAIAGSSTSGTPNARTKPVVWQDGTPTELPRFSDLYSGAAASINDRGQVVGSMTLASISNPVGVVWHKGVVYNLNALVAADDPLKPYITVRQAVEITNKGTILARAEDSRTNSTVFVLLKKT